MHLGVVFFLTGYKKRLCDTETEAWNSMGISDTGHSICIFLIFLSYLSIFSARIDDTPGQNPQHDTPSGMELHLFYKGSQVHT